MKNINNFYFNKDVGGHKNCLSLKIFIEQFVKDYETTIILGNLSKILEIPTNVLKDKSKQIILGQFNFKIGKFNSKFSILKLFLDYIIFFFLFFVNS